MYVAGKHEPDRTKRYDGYDLSWKINRMNYIHVIKRVFRRGGEAMWEDFPIISIPHG